MRKDSRLAQICKLRISGSSSWWLFQPSRGWKGKKCRKSYPVLSQIIQTLYWLATLYALIFSTSRSKDKNTFKGISSSMSLIWLNFLWTTSSLLLPPTCSAQAIVLFSWVLSLLLTLTAIYSFMIHFESSSCSKEDSPIIESLGICIWLALRTSIWLSSSKPKK